MQKKNNAILLLSSGLDSVTALALAKKKYTLLALTFDYGQRAARQEINSAKKITKFYKIPLEVIQLPWFKKIIKTSLVNSHKKIPVLNNIRQGSKATAKAVWVPNRNGLFLNIAAAFAESKGTKTIIAGFNQEEAHTFPDNSLDFCQAANKFFSYSTLNKVKVINYFFNKNKKDILKTAIKKQVPLQFIWSCYYGYNKFCGKCESCLRLKSALLANNKLEIYAKKYKNYRGLL